MVQQVDDTSRQPAASDIDVYNSLEEIQRQYTRISELQTDDKRGFRGGEKKMMDLLITEARKLGADAIIVLEKGNKKLIMPDPMGGGNISTFYPFINAAAIVYQQ